LVHTVASGSIPIVAGKDNKPDYSHYMPKGSYINILDFDTIEALVERLKFIASNKEEYEKYISFKKNHNYTREYLLKLPLPQIIEIAKTIIDPSETFFKYIIDKEKSEDKICKIARYLVNHPKEVVEAQIEQHRLDKPRADQACSTSLLSQIKS
jgi:hypothetical protein